MQCIYLNADGTLMATTESLQQCTGYVLVPSTDANAYIQSIQITATDVLSSFTWGFSLVITLGYISYKVKLSRQIINKL
jgi:hypothetical protein